MMVERPSAPLRDDLAPIALFVFNRPDHTRLTLQALAANEGASRSTLHVFADGPRNEADRVGTAAVRELVRNASGFATVRVYESEKNKGLARSIIDGVTFILSTHDRIVVVEDDLITSRQFLNFINDGLDLYLEETKVASIHGYVYPVDCALPETFFIKGADCWGWGTWARAWGAFNPDARDLHGALVERGLGDAFDFDGTYPYMQMLDDNIAGKNESWAIRWLASTYLEGMLTLYPGASLVDNIGFDGSGTTLQEVDYFRTRLRDERIEMKSIAAEESAFCREAFKKYFAKITSSQNEDEIVDIEESSPQVGLLRKILRRLGASLGKPPH